MTATTLALLSLIFAFLALAARRTTTSAGPIPEPGSRPMFLTINVNGTVDVIHRFVVPQPSNDEITAVVAPLLTALETRLMSALSDQIAALGTSTDAAVTRVTTDVTTLKATIADLQAKVDAGLATPEDIAALTALQAKVDGLDPQSPVVLPPTP